MIKLGLIVRRFKSRQIVAQIMGRGRWGGGGEGVALHDLCQIEKNVPEFHMIYYDLIWDV